MNKNVRVVMVGCVWIAIVGSVLVFALGLGLSRCAPTRTRPLLLSTPQIAELRPSPTPRPAASLQPETPPPVGIRRIVTNTLELREYWRMSQGYLPGSYQDRRVQAISGKVVYCEAGGPTVGMFHRLRVLDATSGDVLWEAQEGWDCSPLAVDAERVYLVVDNGLTLRTYGLEEGRLLWEQARALKRKVFYMYVDGEDLHAYIAYPEPGKEVYHFDVRIGDYSSDSSLPPDCRHIFARLPSLILYVDTLELFRAWDVRTQEVLWSADILSGGSFVWPVVLSNDVLLVSVVTNRLFAMDAWTGQLKWQNEGMPFASNAVVMNGSVYALDWDAHLVRMDLHTGQETGYIQFTPASTDMSTNFYFVATDGQMLFVHFGDSQELIALGP